MEPLAEPAKVLVGWGERNNNKSIIMNVVYLYIYIYKYTSRYITINSNYKGRKWKSLPLIFNSYPILPFTIFHRYRNMSLIYKTLYYLLGLFKKTVESAEACREKQYTSAVNFFSHDPFIQNKLESHLIYS